MFFFSVYCVAYGSFFGEDLHPQKVNKSIASHHLHGAWDQGGGGLEIFTWSWTSLHEITYTVAEAAKPVVFLWIPSPFHPRWSFDFRKKPTNSCSLFPMRRRRHDDVVTNKVTMWERICHSKIVPNDLWDEESASSISLFSYMNSILPVSNILPVNHHFGDEVIWGRWNLARYLCNVWWYLHHDLYISYPYTAYSLHSFPHIYIHTCPAWVNTSH